MFKSVTFISMAVFAIIGGVEANWAFSPSPKNKITAKGDRGEIETSYYTENKGGEERIFFTVKLTDKKARSDRNGLNVYLDWAKPENWGARWDDGQDKTRVGHTQRLLLSGKIEGGSTLEVTPLFARTLDDEIDGENKTRKD